jgi:hypothetical protein
MNKQSVSTGHIDYLEKDFLDNFRGKINVSSLNISEIREARFIKINEISNFWELHEKKITSLRLFMEDIISGLYEGNIPLIFAIFGKVDKVEIVIGSYARKNQSVEDNLEIIKTSLKSSFQGIGLEEQAPDYLKKNIDNFDFPGLITGTPTEKTGIEKVGIEQIERVIRGLYGREWGYVVIATPATNSEINSLFNAVLSEIRIVINSEKSTGIESPIGKRYKELLQAYLNRLQLAKAQGMWHTVIFLFSADHDTLNHVKAVAKSAFGGRGSLPDRIRSLDFDRKISNPGMILNPPPDPPGHFKYPYNFMNTTTSADLANFIHIPSQEMPGFQIKPYARFNVSTDVKEGKTIRIGEVLDQGDKMGIPYRISLKNLKKHGLIVGTTGSGKTNTLFYLLKEAWKHEIPFLVIEPVKTEYRKLLSYGDLHVFTLGDNTVSPFRINPFEIMPEVPVQTHIDLLKSVFNASFFMWGPLPHILERCIHEIYTDKGWDLASNENLRGVHRNANPTLTDLYHKVDEVVERLGYSIETTMEVGSALKTRINSLRIGGKGLMLDTRRSIPFETLINTPTVLELEPIGDDEEKSFMMGLILTMMYENYVSQGISEKKDLRHITVIEEAHRLLANYATENPYVANVKGKGVETFTNILSEIRAYGEGFLIAEQIPTKLAPDVIKNTNLKVMHRVVAEDDRRVMGATMNIGERETKKIVSFERGEAAVYSEGDDGAYYVEVPYSKIEDKGGTKKDDDMVIKAMENFRKDAEHFAPFEGCRKYCKAICKYKSIGDAVSSNYKFYSQMPSLVLSLIDNAHSTDSILLQMLERGRDEGEIVNDPKGIKICTIIQGTERYFEKVGSQYYWSYEDVENLKDIFLEFYMEALEEFMVSGVHFSSEVLDHSKVTRFQDSYRSLCEDKQPTSFCSEICPEKFCLYRFNLSEALKDDDYDTNFEGIIMEDADNMYEDLGILCREVAEQFVLPGGGEETVGKIALCFALQKIQRFKNFRRKDIWSLIRDLKKEMEEINNGKE